jgi:hypothetical protein
MNINQYIKGFYRKLYDNKQKDHTEAILKQISEDLRNLTLSVELQQQNSLDASKNNKTPASPKGKKLATKSKTTSSGGTPSIEDLQLPKHFPYFKGYHTISSISKAVCTCSTIFSKKQLFFYINELASQSNIVCNQSDSKIL